MGSSPCILDRIRRPGMIIEDLKPRPSRSLVVRWVMRLREMVGAWLVSLLVRGLPHRMG